MSDDELADHVVALERHRARLDGALADALARFDTHRTYENDGAVTAKAWLKHHCHMTGPQAGARLAVARRLQRFPVIAAALRAGEITFDQVRLMLTALHAQPPNRPSPTIRQTLVDVARSVHIDDLAHVLDVWAAFTDPDGTEPDHTTDTLHLDQGLDGRFHLQGDIDSADGDLLGRALEAAERHLGSTSDPRGRPHRPRRPTSPRTGRLWRATTSTAPRPPRLHVRRSPSSPTPPTSPSASAPAPNGAPGSRATTCDGSSATPSSRPHSPTPTAT